MRRSDTSETGGARAGPTNGFAALAVLAAGGYAAHAWLGDSPYWIQLSHRPLIAALRAAALALDWSQGVKLAVILGSSLSVLRTDAPRPSRGPKAPSLPKAAPAFGAFALETAR
jgi:hypothetical protein